MLHKLFKRNNKKNINKINVVKQYKIPQHIAIIMDGNGRWANKRALPRVVGHHEGMKTVHRTTLMANELGVKYLTVYAFSTENWKRPKLEVDFLMRLPEEFLNKYLDELMEKNIRIQMMGDLQAIPSFTYEVVQRAVQETKNNTGLTLCFALNYGGRAEIVHAVKAISESVANGQLLIENISEETISDHLMTAELPEPDLLIRTSGEVRLSNFMLWQLAYTELWFTDTLWPDFDEACLLDAIESYQKRNRRYGGLKGEEIN